MKVGPGREVEKNNIEYEGGTGEGVEKNNIEYEGEDQGGD